MELILASTSPYRRDLLARLQLPFRALAPRYHETARSGENPEALVRRHAEGKARSLAGDHPEALIIGSDQLAELDGDALGKPGDLERARRQLEALSGRRVVFLTALCLLNSASGRLQSSVERIDVELRALTGAQIERYLERERPFDCAGALKVEGPGITLLERLGSGDPTGLIGLPLMRLAELLRAEGMEPL